MIGALEIGDHLQTRADDRVVLVGVHREAFEILDFLLVVRALRAPYHRGQENVVASALQEEGAEARPDPEGLLLERGGLENDPGLRGDLVRVRPRLGDQGIIVQLQVAIGLGAEAKAAPGAPLGVCLLYTSPSPRD